LCRHPNPITTRIEPREDVISVSNLDLIPNTYQASVLCIYPKTPTGNFAAVVAAFEAGLPSLLSHFFPLTGRIVTNPSSGLPEVHCRNQLGSELVVGDAGEVALRSLDFRLAEASLKRILVPYDDDVALSVQLVSFACGGFSVAWSNNNLVLDGCSATRLVRTWSELARSGTISGLPNFDRSVLRPRDPPSYSSAVDEMFTPFDGRHLVNVLTARESFVERLYYVEARDIEMLREMASNAEGGRRASRVHAVSAYLWKALAAAVVAASTKRGATGGNASCRMGWYVDGRWRVTSPELRAALRDYVGNVTPYVVTEATAETIPHKSLAEVAAMAREAIRSVDYDERVRELVDWVEEHKPQDVVEAATVGLGSPTVSQTVWASFPLDTDFGFGHAALAMPVWESEGLCSGNVVVREATDRGSSVLTCGRG
ncbi:hypothetical protein EJB05_42159, partial [Eragrostis curvula]